MIPQTDDGRILFFVPWLDHVLLGTTDTPVKEISLEPKPFEEEVDFLLRHAGKYLTKEPGPSDVLSAFAGLRPLVKTSDDPNTANLSREHQIFVSESGLITVAGGKWTTYRKMAEDAVDKAISIGNLHQQPCKTEHLHLHGYTESPDQTLPFYGSDAEIIKKFQDWNQKLHPSLNYTKGSLIWAIRKEMARTLEDLLARRTRCLFLNAQASLDIAYETVTLLATELKKTEEWKKEQLHAFTALQKNYTLGLPG